MVPVLYGITIFLSAFLLFFIQPFIAKAMLPHFGGAGFVWISTILFFQIVLLLGYCYAYVLAKWFSEKKQAVIHFLLLGISLFYIPVYLHYTASLDQLWSPWAVILLLSKNVLFPCVVISASSPLLQHWYCQIRQTTFPYVYYSVSNAGSLIGLLGYPFLFEPLIGLKVQSITWSILYALYVFLCIACLGKLILTKNYKAKIDEIFTVSTSILLKWLLLTFLSSALLISTTQFLVQNVINLPLLWVLPLALYLISYIVIFSTPKHYNNEFWSASFFIWLLMFSWLIYNSQLAGVNVVIVILALLYSSCMICHGELIKTKPPVKDLTLFYMVIALGGVFGGIFSNIIALRWFIHWWDLYLPLIIISIISAIILTRQYISSKIKWNLALCSTGIIITLTYGFVVLLEIYNPNEIRVAQYRNPYGMIRVYDFINNTNLPRRAIFHGMVVHGLQLKAPLNSHFPTTYYGYHSGVGYAFHYLKEHNHSLNVGIVGLGCGTLSSFGEKGDVFTFYEIDPDVITVANNFFSFLKESKATINIVEGDARLSLQKSSTTLNPPKFDLLVLDAFNGDAIPAHLLTTEAMQIYQKLVVKHGIIAIHISNTYINLLPVTMALAKDSNCMHWWIQNKSEVDKGIFSASWVLISCDPGLGGWLKQHDAYFDHQPTISPRLWTDDYNTILPLLEWHG
ncbi:MAG: fused MFS/spermidine synthase [Proteobacteria bacterium]|nr:fused MFS/spermidine synthase [Pseudomonadota bacterium]